ncbi:CinA family protein, partial [bacterium]|nr:CinA family protein [bacterium]
ALTDISGSSGFVHLNFVTYSNEAKHKILGVKTDTLEKYGAVSEQTSLEMAEGLFQVSGADICISTTGIAGPTGGTKEKPVGLMYSTIFMHNKKFSKTYKILLPSNTPRIEMKKKFVEEVLKNLYEILIS